MVIKLKWNSGSCTNVKYEFLITLIILIFVIMLFVDFFLHLKCAELLLGFICSISLCCSFSDVTTFISTVTPSPRMWCNLKSLTEMLEHWQNRIPQLSCTQLQMLSPDLWNVYFSWYSLHVLLDYFKQR